MIGIIKQDSRSSYREIIADLVGNGAEGIILACTEIVLLVKLEGSPAPLFDTTQIHAEPAVDYASA